MTARTPGPWTVVPSAVSQRFDLRNESTGLIWNRALKNSAACELAATKNEVERLTARRDALREVLRGCYTNAVYLNSGFTAPVYRDMLATIAENCRAALAIADGAK